jgi:hypothetical protein
LYLFACPASVRHGRPNGDQPGGLAADSCPHLLTSFFFSKPVPIFFGKKESEILLFMESSF